MRVTASVDYALRAMIELAVASPDGRPVKGDEIASRQGVPFKFLEQLLADLRRGGLVTSSRGYSGGYRLALEPGQITVADIIRIIEGPLADVHGSSPESLDPPGRAAITRDLWVATRAALRSVLERVTLADLVAGELPAEVAARLRDPGAWARR